MGHAGLEFLYPLLLDVVVGRWVDHRKTDEENVCVWIGEWPQLIVVLLQTKHHEDDQNQNQVLLAK